MDSETKEVIRKHNMIHGVDITFADLSVALQNGSLDEERLREEKKKLKDYLSLRYDENLAIKNKK